MYLLSRFRVACDHIRGCHFQDVTRDEFSHVVMSCISCRSWFMESFSIDTLLIERTSSFGSLSIRLRLSIIETFFNVVVNIGIDLLTLFYSSIIFFLSSSYHTRKLFWITSRIWYRWKSIIHWNNTRYLCVTFCNVHLNKCNWVSNILRKLNEPGLLRNLKLD